MPSYLAASLEETAHIAKMLAKTIPVGSVVAFFGDLGAGKTTFIRAFATHFGISSEEINSPTFQYLNIYKSPCPLYHFDLYRLRGIEDFLGLGFEEYFVSDGICLIEWAERIEAILPKNSILIRIRHDEINSRHIDIEGLVCQK
jgi:tRNA threonylcarbamoyladenosine biosynthesis protein TsaE